jgi:hypothetical protein
MTSFLRENLVWNSLTYCEPMKTLQNGSDMMKFWILGDGTGSRIEKKLNTIDLSIGKIEQERVLINFAVIERSGNRRSRSVIISCSKWK